MTSEEFSMEEFTQMALTALRQAVARVMEDHRRRGKPVAIWKNGRVVLKIPDAPSEVRESRAQYDTKPTGQKPNRDGTSRGD
jgi:hypothetical protein